MTAKNAMAAVSDVPPHIFLQILEFVAVTSNYLPPSLFWKGGQDRLTEPGTPRTIFFPSNTKPIATPRMAERNDSVAIIGVGEESCSVGWQGKEVEWETDDSRYGPRIDVVGGREGGRLELVLRYRHAIGLWWPADEEEEEKEEEEETEVLGFSEIVHHLSFLHFSIGGTLAVRLQQK
ncbi:hypothetical protein M0804_000350 [Polistes exclamans]|nr:hypothetical protein M0804_000350 [Polistes exclamans]